MNISMKSILATGFVFVNIGNALAAATPEELRLLNSTLTPTGAEIGGTADGMIPAYTGGLTTPPPSFVKGSPVRPDPFVGEKPLFSISSKNVDKYQQKLTEGTKALMKLYPDYRIDVYPSHRTVAFPKYVIENTLKNAARAQSPHDGQGITGARAGIPFPIPHDGNEVMLNGLASYKGGSYYLPKFTAYNVDSSGKVTMGVQGSYRVDFPYYDSSRSDNVLSRARALYASPARRAGEGAQSVAPLDYTNTTARAHQYLPGQRRVRLAPDLSYDTPNSGTSGMSTMDEVGLFNGALDRYSFKLIGKKEMFIPYNDYRFLYNDNPENVFQAKFINPDVVRWELHRVWIVDGTLKEGKRHIYSRRTYYLDEDSWAFVASDEYDGRKQLWRVGFAYPTQSYDVSAPTAFTSGHYDLIAGTYYINVWPGKSGVIISDKQQSDSYWSPDNLAAQGVR